MMFNRKKNDIENLNTLFGKLKEDSFDFELIEKYFRSKDDSTVFQVLSDKTCHDLDFQELFMFLDRTHSKVGQQFLYNQLRAITVDSVKQDLHEKLIEKLSKEVDFRVKTQRLLSLLNKDEVFHIASLFQDEHLKPPKWFFIIKLLSFINLLSLILYPFYSYFIVVFIVVATVNLGIHYWNKKNLYHYLGSVPQLIKLNNVALKLFKEGEFKEINKNIRHSIKVIEQVKIRMSFFQLEAKIQGDFQLFFWSILEIFKIIFLIEPLMLFSVLKRLSTRRKEIEEVFCFVGQIDCLISIASLRKGLDSFCLPQISMGELSAQRMYHPLILDCVTNSIHTHGHSVLLTGSNMSGKTSFIRAIGINHITGLALNTCFAQEMTIPKAPIYSAIRISDDLMNDKSYYFEEVLTIKEMIQSSVHGQSSLFLLDEIFKGTNTVERISAGKAVLSSLAKNNNIVFVSTHDIELTDMLRDEYDLYHFSEIIDDKNIDFDYKLKEGKLKNRNAIRILQINDYPAELINEAIEISQILDGAIAPGC